MSSIFAEFFSYITKLDDVMFRAECEFVSLWARAEKALNPAPDSSYHIDVAMAISATQEALA